ncbi:MAG: hypothetical protein IPO29_13115 [Anaerolineae bacterium]|nr:hypothetical protein [Anaerolineae bacterium]
MSDAAARNVARAATLTSAGNLSSRIVGFIAVAVRAFFFGNSQAASAFELAANIPTIFNDLLAGRMLSSALVPTFTGLAVDAERHEAKPDLSEYGRLLGALLGLGAALLTALVALLLLLADPLATVITAGRNQDIGLVAGLLRITIPAILFMNLGAVVTAALQARHRFEYTAFTATAFNVVMIVCTVAFQAQMGVMALAFGMLAGSAVQAAMQLPGLRGVPIRLSLNWRLPGVSKIIRLFLPVAGGLVLAQLAAQLSFTLANVISPQGPTTMRYAAQVIQFPLGLVSAAISAAILPTLSAQALGPAPAFKATLSRGLGLVVGLTAPAAVGLFVLATPDRGAALPTRRVQRSEHRLHRVVAAGGGAQPALLGHRRAADLRLLCPARHAHPDPGRAGLDGRVSAPGRGGDGPVGQRRARVQPGRPGAVRLAQDRLRCVADGPAAVAPHRRAGRLVAGPAGGQGRAGLGGDGRGGLPGDGGAAGAGRICHVWGSGGRGAGFIAGRGARLRGPGWAAQGARAARAASAPVAAKGFRGLIGAA